MRKAWIIIFLFAGCAKLHKYHPMPWVVGQWVSYEVNGEPLKVSLVGKDSSGFWLETVGPEAIVKMLVERGEAQPKRCDLKRLIVKPLGDLPIEFSLDEFGVKSELLSIKMDSSMNFKEEIFTLPCGKLRVFHTTQEGSDIWVSGKVPIFGVVKYKSNDNLIVLCDYGIKGAESEIKQQPEVANFIIGGIISK